MKQGAYSKMIYQNSTAKKGKNLISTNQNICSTNKKNLSEDRKKKNKEELNFSSFRGKNPIIYYKDIFSNINTERNEFFEKVNKIANKNKCKINSNEKMDFSLLNFSNSNNKNLEKNLDISNENDFSSGKAFFKKINAKLRENNKEKTLKILDGMKKIEDQEKKIKEIQVLNKNLEKFCDNNLQIIKEKKHNFDNLVVVKKKNFEDFQLKKTNEKDYTNKINEKMKILNQYIENLDEQKKNEISVIFFDIKNKFLIK